jgi:hypothetical protein
MSNTPTRVNPVVLTCVVVLCVIACTLTFLLPGDSLVVDLIYQGF